MSAVLPGMELRARRLSMFEFFALPTPQIRSGQLLQGMNNTPCARLLHLDVRSVASPWSTNEMLNKQGTLRQSMQPLQDRRKERRRKLR